jgi:hypothetical protein
MYLLQITNPLKKDELYFANDTQRAVPTCYYMTGPLRSYMKIQHCFNFGYIMGKEIVDASGIQTVFRERLGIRGPL